VKVRTGVREESGFLKQEKELKRFYSFYFCSFSVTGRFIRFFPCRQTIAFVARPAKSMLTNKRETAANGAGVVLPEHCRHHIL